MGGVALIAACLVGMLFADPDENGFEYTSTESYLSVSPSVPEGVSDIPPGTTRSIQVTVTRTSWEVWTHPVTSEVITKNMTTEPVPFASCSCWVSQGDAYLSGSGCDIDASGYGSLSVTMGSSAAVVDFSVSDFAGASASASTTLTPAVPVEETWSYSHSEGVLRASLTSSGGTSSVSQGTETPLQLAVEYETWTVEISNYGNTRTINHAVTGASGASIIWSVSGDGSVTGVSNAGWDGLAQGSFIMGSGNSSVTAQISYAGSDSCSAQIDFTPPTSPSSQFDHYRTVYWFVPDTAVFVDVVPGDMRDFSGTLYKMVEEIWLDPSGTAYVNAASPTELAGGESITFTIYGNASMTNQPSVTDGAGHFTASVTMGDQSSTAVVAMASDPAVEAAFTFTPPYVPPPAEPYLLRTESYTVITLDSGNNQSAARGETVVFGGRYATVSVEIWTDNVTEWTQNSTDELHQNAELVFTVIQENGTLGSATATTDANGVFTGELSMGYGTTSMIIGIGVSGYPPLTVVNFIPPDEVWSSTGSPYLVRTLTAWADSYEDLPGSSTSVTVRLEDVYWIQQDSDLGNTRHIPLDDDTLPPQPVQGAEVSFSVPAGSAGSVQATATTDGGGLALVDYSFGLGNGAVIIEHEQMVEGLYFFNPEVQWSDWMIGSQSKVQITATTPANGLITGDVVPVKAHVVIESYRWRESNFGQVQMETISSNSAINAPLQFVVSTPNGGTIAAEGGASTTDSNGDIFASFVMGTAAYATIQASTPYQGGWSYSQHILYRDTGWLPLPPEEFLVVTLSPPEFPPRSLEVKVDRHVLHKWAKNGVERLGTEVSGPVENASVQFAMGGSSAVVEAPAGATSSIGKYLTRVAASDGAQIDVTASFGALSGSATYTMPQGVQEIDEDGDGLSNGHELLLQLNPWNIDSDGDGIPDLLEDTDGDGWNNRDELALGSDAASSQTAVAIHAYSSMNRLESSIGGGRSFSYNYDPEGNINH